MKLHFMTVPVFDSEQAEAELNRFLSSHRVLSISRELVTHEARCAWAICITYQDGQAGGPPKGAGSPAPSSGRRAPRVDYKEVLTSEQFQVFAQLRLLRKSLAEKDGVPVYNIFSNEQLAEMVVRQVCTLNQLEAIGGIGPARRQKYGQAFLERLATAQAAAGSDKEGS